MQHKEPRVSRLLQAVFDTVTDDDVRAALAWLDVVRLVVDATDADVPLEHRESTEAARPEVRGERTEPAAPEPVSASEDVTAVDGPQLPGVPSAGADVPVRRSHELLRIDGIPADSYPFLPTDRTVDVHVRHCRRCGASCDRLRLHFGEQPPEVNVFCEYLCSACA